MSPLTKYELMACKWLQTTTMSNSNYPRYSGYFRDLIFDGWIEEDLLRLPQNTFAYYELNRAIMYCSISEFCNAYLQHGKFSVAIDYLKANQSSNPEPLSGVKVKAPDFTVWQRLRIWLHENVY